ncbi:hypothetical protein, partial [Paenibacillus sp. SAFN-117]|uniref:hypothetical protein n=1 Tax=Paenibacillus sp. SAFN-117 TaxID=3436860 RepID=UPI003F7EBFE5
AGKFCDFGDFPFLAGKDMHFCSSFSSFAGFPQKDMHFCSSSRQLWLYASSACKKNRTFG